MWNDFSFADPGLNANAKAHAARVGIRSSGRLVWAVTQSGWRWWALAPTNIAYWSVPIRCKGGGGWRCCRRWCLPRAWLFGCRSFQDRYREVADVSLKMWLGPSSACIRLKFVDSFPIIIWNSYRQVRIEINVPNFNETFIRLADKIISNDSVSFCYEI